MKRLVCATIAGLIATHSALATDTNPNGNSSTTPITIAVFGDWPYNQLLLDNAALLTNSVNADPAVSLVVHVGDIHSGSMPCTSAGILPAISTSMRLTIDTRQPQPFSWNNVPYCANPLTSCQ